MPVTKKEHPQITEHDGVCLSQSTSNEHSGDKDGELPTREYFHCAGKCKKCVS